jgi:hypothetical protein
MRIIEKIKFLPFYPFFFTLYPLLALTGSNISEITISAVWRLLIFMLLGVFITTILFFFLIRDWHRVAITISVLALLFFTYGHLYSYLKTVEISGFVLGRHRQLLPLWTGLGVLGCWWSIRTLRNPRAVAPTLNLISAFLLVYPLFQTVSYVTHDYQIRRATANRFEQTVYTELPLGYAPDIYYIILDAYGRADTLQNLFGYENSAFLDFLEAKGFYVADCAQSNYSQTILSLSSSLNLNYIDKFAPDLEKDDSDPAPLIVAGQYNSTRKMLESMGYHTVSLSTKFPVSEWKDAQYYLEPPVSGMTDFELMFAQTTVWRASMDFIKQPPEKRFANWDRRRTLFLLEQLSSNVIDLPSPKFVFAHFIIPHRPFVFGPNGEEMDSKFYQPGKMGFDIFSEGYINQVKFINKNIEQVINRILETSSKPPIIIIQGDHGPDFWSVKITEETPAEESWDFQSHRMYILNAYYFPGDSSGLYENISPVNTFRLIFNKYFGKKYEMLEDISRYSSHARPYDYSVVAPMCSEVLQR